MDSEAAVIRAEMSRTRAQLDRNLTLLEERARDMVSPRSWDQYLPEFFYDRALGATLTVIGLRMALGNARRLSRQRRQRRRRGSRTVDARLSIA